MANDLIIPEIVLVNKLEELETTLPLALWEDLRNIAIVTEKNDAQLPAPVRHKKKMFISDFVNKAISLPLEISPSLSDETQKQLTRLHLFCCQRAVYDADIRRNPLMLGFRALEEMKTALIGILISYRLINPSCPYSWNQSFFENAIFTHKGTDGHTIIQFKGIPAKALNQAITEELVTDWLIYRAYDNNGIKTLMDIKNNLLTLPNYQRGGRPEAEFSRFERKMQEARNKKEMKKNDTLDLEFRKTLVQTIAEKTAAEMIASGMSTEELLNQAYNGDLRSFINNKQETNNAPQKQQLDETSPQELPTQDKKQSLKPATNKSLPAPKNKKTSEDIDEIISRFL